MADVRRKLSFGHRESESLFSITAARWKLQNKVRTNSLLYFSVKQTSLKILGYSPQFILGFNCDNVKQVCCAQYNMVSFQIW